MIIHKPCLYRSMSSSLIATYFKYSCFIRLLMTCKIVFVLFHGQGFIERGFSINRDLINHNLLERTVVTRRIVCDSVASILLGKGIKDTKAVENLDITKDMLRYCRLARSRYRNFLDEQKALEKADILSRKKHELRDKIKEEQIKLSVRKILLISLQKQTIWL